MIVLSLIVVGFAQLARREQRDTLDRNLSAQAFYAAESGINNAQNAIKVGGFTGNIDNCNTPFGIAAYDNKVLDAASDTQFTCVLVDQTPPTLTYDTISVDKSKIIRIDAKNSANVQKKLRSLELYWEPNTHPNFSSITFPTGTSNFPVTWGANVPGVLRVDLVPTNSGYDTQTAAQGALTFFGYPKTTGSGSIAYASGLANQGSIVDAKCEDIHTNDHPQMCKITIDFATPFTGEYYLRVRSIYSDSSLSIRGKIEDGGPVQARFGGEQAVIDSTGKANDVLKRVKVGRNIGPDTGPQAEDALRTSGEICKLLEVGPVLPAPTSYPGFANTCPGWSSDAPSPQN